MMELIVKKICDCLDDIDNYYLTIRGTNNLLDFLRIELKCIYESLDFIDLSILQLSKEYIDECKQTVYKALKDNNFRETTRKLYPEIIDKISQIKRYTQMSDYERSVYSAFLLLFTREIESGDLMIGIFTDEFLNCTKNKEVEYLKIMEKYFGDIIKNGVRPNVI
jgi:predicted translin family RNA/ssDNA-binding protein